MRAVWLLVVLALAACGDATSGGGGASTGGSGVVVRTVVDQGCPVQQAGSSCPVLPVAAHIVVLDAHNAVVAQSTTGSDGEARVALRPGQYLVRGERPDARINPRTGPVAVTVPDGGFATVRLQFDSGVRMPEPPSR